MTRGAEERAEERGAEDCRVEMRLSSSARAARAAERAEARVGRRSCGMPMDGVDEGEDDSIKSTMRTKD